MMNFKITTEVPGMGEVTVAQADDYHFARTLARCASAEDGGRYHLLSAKPTAFTGEWFAGGISES
jgi:hypothetical protein